MRAAILNALSKVVKLPLEHASRLFDPSFNIKLSELAIDSLDALELCMEIETNTGAERAGLANLNRSISGVSA